MALGSNGYVLGDPIDFVDFLGLHGEKNLFNAIANLWRQRENICRDITKGLKGGLNGYRTIRDNTNKNVPLGIRIWLKSTLTITEMGLTAGLPSGIDSMYNIFSGFFFDTIPTNTYGYAGYYARQYLDAFFIFPAQGKLYNIDTILPIPIK